MLHLHVSVKVKMGKSCVIGCTNRYSKRDWNSFSGRDCKTLLIVAVACKDWSPSEYTLICSAHFVSGSKSNNPLSPDYVPSVFAHTKSPAKQRAVEDIERFTRNSDEEWKTQTDS